MDNVKLKLIENNELKAAYCMQIKGFLPTFIKYRDRINPVFTPYKKFKSNFNKENTAMFWILYNGVRVGHITLYFKEDFIHISNLFVLSEYQNKGIAQSALKLAEDMFCDYKRWHLFTIKQEKRNIHLYEKSGYKFTGEERKINSRMTLVEYEKEKL